MNRINDLITEAARRVRMPDPELCRAIRKSVLVTQSEIAAALHVDRSTVARWELGTRRPSGNTLEQYLALLEGLVDSTRGRS